MRGTPTSTFLTNGGIHTLKRLYEQNLAGGNAETYACYY